MEHNKNDKIDELDCLFLIRIYNRMSSEANEAERKAKQRAYQQAYREKVKVKRNALKQELIAKEEERKAKKRVINMIYREKVKANQDKKAIQRAYEASNPILQEERKAYRESKKLERDIKKAKTGEVR